MLTARILRIVVRLTRKDYTIDIPEDIWIWTLQSADRTWNGCGGIIYKTFLPDVAADLWRKVWKLEKKLGSQPADLTFTLERIVSHYVEPTQGSAIACC